MLERYGWTVAGPPGSPLQRILFCQETALCSHLVSDEIHETSRKEDQTESKRTSRTAESGLLLFMD